MVGVLPARAPAPRIPEVQSFQPTPHLMLSQFGNFWPFFPNLKMRAYLGNVFHFGGNVSLWESTFFLGIRPILGIYALTET